MIGKRVREVETVPPPATLTKTALLGPTVRVRYRRTGVRAQARQVERMGLIETTFEGVYIVKAGWWYVLDGCEAAGVSVWSPARFGRDFEVVSR